MSAPKPCETDSFHPLGSICSNKQLAGNKRVEEWVDKAIAKHAGIVWLDRTAIFKDKSSFLSSQTIPACFAIALWTHSSTRFVIG